MKLTIKDTSIIQVGSAIGFVVLQLSIAAAFYLTIFWLCYGFNFLMKGNFVRYGIVVLFTVFVLAIATSSRLIFQKEKLIWKSWILLITEIGFESIESLKLITEEFSNYTVVINAVPGADGRRKKYKVRYVSEHGVETIVAAFKNYVPTIPVIEVRSVAAKYHLASSCYLTLMLFGLGVNVYYEYVTEPTASPQWISLESTPAIGPQKHEIGDVAFELPEKWKAYPEESRTQHGGRVLFVEPATNRQLIGWIVYNSPPFIEENIKNEIKAFSSYIGIIAKAERVQFRKKVRRIYKFAENDATGWIFLKQDRGWPIWNAVSTKHNVSFDISLLSHYDQMEALEIVKQLVRTVSIKSEETSLK